MFMGAPYARQILVCQNKNGTGPFGPAPPFGSVTLSGIRRCRKCATLFYASVKLTPEGVAARTDHRVKVVAGTGVAPVEVCI